MRSVSASYAPFMSSLTSGRRKSHSRWVTPRPLLSILPESGGVVEPIVDLLQDRLGGAFKRYVQLRRDRCGLKVDFDGGRSA